MSAPSFFCPSTEPYLHPTQSLIHRADDVVGLLALKEGERVLDLGCGDGQLSSQLANHGAELVGFESSLEHVLAARTRGLDIKQGNAEHLYFHQEFDAVFSHDALHEMRQAEQVAMGAFMALRPGGRFVGEFAGSAHAALVLRALNGALERRSISRQGLDRWYLPTAHEYQRVLERAGFHVSYISWFEQPLLLERPIGDWIKNCCGHYLRAVPVEMRIPFLEEVTEELVGDLLDTSGRWMVDATRLRFRAQRKA